MKSIVKGLMLVLASGAFGVALSADAPATKDAWSANDINNSAYPEADAKAKAANPQVFGRQLFATPTHNMSLVSRYKGAPEFHVYENDIMIVKEGTGALLVGGELVDKKQLSPEQATGSSIKGGQMIEMGPGSIIHVPKSTPHQWILKDGQHVVYYAIKAIDK